MAENTNRFLDDTIRVAPLRLANESGRATDAASVEYRPTGVPHPISAARRGIASEVSPDVLDSADRGNLLVVGLAFDLDGLHPSLLMLALSDLTAEEILQARRVSPGSEFIEGDLRFVPADITHPETRRVLAQECWIPAGQASLVRSLEFLAAVQRERRLSSADLLPTLRSD